MESPYEDVPEHLAAHLWRWILNGFTSQYEDRRGRWGLLAVHLRIALSFDEYEAEAELRDLCNRDPLFMLDVAEAMLEIWGEDQGRSRQLNAVLTVTNSAYRVRADSKGLEVSVTPEVQEQVQAVVDAATGSPGDHLRDAWNEAYGRTPDPVKSYSEAIKAVEAAMAPVISPQNLKQTLGTMIKDVESKPSKWKFEIADGRATGVGTVLAMMQVLWDGQTSRHGGVNPTRAETVEEARAAVHIAATLVQFAVGKSFRVV